MAACSYLQQPKKTNISLLLSQLSQKTEHPNIWINFVIAKILFSGFWLIKEVLILTPGFEAIFRLSPLSSPLEDKYLKKAVIYHIGGEEKLC